MIVPWPSWHPDQELKADHLLGLEDYLLTRVLMVDEGAWGIDSFEDYKQSLKVEESASGLTIKARLLRGVTTRGEHVWLWSEDEWLETNLETTASGDFELDLWVVVNSREKDASKLT